MNELTSLSPSSSSSSKSSQGLLHPNELTSLSSSKVSSPSHDDTLIVITPPSPYRAVAIGSVWLIVIIAISVGFSSLSSNEGKNQECIPTTPRGFPEQVSVNLGQDPARTLTMNWAVTRQCKSTKPRVHYSTDQCNVASEKSQSLDAIETSYTTTTNDTAGNFPNYISPMLYSAMISNLNPNTTYFYRVGDETCGWSPIFSTSTAPLPGTLGVRFAVVGDVGTTSNSINTLQGILDAHKRSPYAAMLLVGDLSYEDGNNTVWDEFGRMKEFLASSVNIQVLPGNHGVSLYIYIFISIPVYYCFSI